MAGRVRAAVPHADLLIVESDSVKGPVLDVPLVARHFYHHAGWAQLMAAELPGRTADKGDKRDAGATGGGAHGLPGYTLAVQADLSGAQKWSGTAQLQGVRLAVEVAQIEADDIVPGAAATGTWPVGEALDLGDLIRRARPDLGLSRTVRHLPRGKLHDVLSSQRLLVLPLVALRRPTHDCAATDVAQTTESSSRI